MQYKSSGHQPDFRAIWTWTSLSLAHTLSISTEAFPKSVRFIWIIQLVYFMDTVNVFIVAYVRTMWVRRRIILWLMNLEGFGRNRSWPTRNATHIYAWRKWEKNVRLLLFGSIFEPGFYRNRVESDTAACFHYSRLLDVLANLRKATINSVMSVWSHGTSRLQLDGISWSWTLDFSRVCHESSSSFNIWQE